MRLTSFTNLIVLIIPLICRNFNKMRKFFTECAAFRTNIKTANVNILHTS